MKSNLLIFLSALLLCLLCSEIVARHFNATIYFGEEGRVFDPIIGWKYKPNYRFKLANNLLQSNHEGFRDFDYSKERTPNTIRIAIIGDSFSEAKDTNIENTFWRLLANSLNNKFPHKKWEVLNFGVSDFGTTQEYLTLENYVLNYHPDILVLQIFPLNDILNNTIAGAGTVSSTDEFRPYLDPRENFERMTYLNPTTSFLRRHFKFFVLIENALMKWKMVSRMVNMKFRRERIQLIDTKFHLSTKNKLPLGIGINTFADESFQIPQIKLGWIATEKALNLIVKLCQKENLPLLAFSIPHETEFNGTILPGDANFPFDFSSAEVRIAKILHAHGVPSFGLSKIFNEKKNKLTPYNNGHLNEFGHQLVAELLEANLLTNFPDLKNNPAKY